MSHNQWQPDTESFRIVRDLMKASASGDSRVQEHVHQQLEKFKTQPEFPSYLAYLLSTSDDSTVRAISGITLKNTIKQCSNTITPEVYHQIRSSTFGCLSDPDATVRSVAGTIITTVLSYQFHCWPGAVETLLEYMDGNNQYAAEGAFGALCKVCEDSASVLEINDNNLAVRVINKLMSLLSHAALQVRSESVIALNYFIMTRSQTLITNLQPFLNSIFMLMSDESSKVKKAVCQTILLILETSSDNLTPRIYLVIDFMCHCLDSEDEDLAMEACEFWLSFVERDNLHDHLESCLPKLVGLLVKRMVYTESYIASYEVINNDCEEPDQDKDIKPRYHKTKIHNLTLEENLKQKNEMGLNFISDHDDYDDEGVYDDDNDDIFSEWNIRKCSSATIDVLSTVFGNELLRHLHPHLIRELEHSDWVHQECGILILGAISDGCTTGLSAELPNLLPFLLSSLKHPHPLIRTISCWTISKYAFWTIFPVEMWFNRPTTPSTEQLVAHRKLYFEPVVYGILDVMLDNNKHVQESACSAFVTVVEVTRDALTPYLDHIIYIFENAFKKYKKKNLLILYDTIGALADSAGKALRDPKYVDSLIGMLYVSWQSIDDMDSNMSPLLECMSSMALALGPSFQPFAKEVWDRNNRILDKMFKLAEQSGDDSNTDIPYKDCIAVSLDLMGNICQALGSNVSELIMSNPKQIISYLELSLSDSSADVRQSAFALVGDIVSSAYEQVKPHLGMIMERIVLQARESSTLQASTTNNAIWAAGEIALKSQKEEFGPWIEVLSELFIETLNSDKSTGMLKRNAAVSLGRMCLTYPNEMSGLLPYFFKAWCDNFTEVNDNCEKKTAFEGIYNVIRINPIGAAQDLSKLCEAVVAWNSMPPDLLDMFREILLTYKNGWGDRWGQIISQWPPQLRQKISEKCGI